MKDVPDLMDAAVLKEFGGPDKLTVEPVPVPSVDADEILIRVHTAGVGVWDPSEREGKMMDMMGHEPSFPYILGSDGSGTVAAVGDEVERFQEGDHVCATGFLNPKGGFYAQYTAVKAEHAIPVPDGLSFEEAGAMPIDAVTALRGLQDALELDEGDSLLIFGASGGVGHLALQLANRMGAKTLAVASGADGRDLVEELGADEWVQGRAEDLAEPMRRLAPNGLDALLVTASGEGLDKALAGLRQGGRLAWPHGVHPEPEVPEGVEGTAYDGRPGRGIMDELARLVDAGPFRVHVDETFGLDEAGDAHRKLDEHYLGKLALRIAD